LDPLTASTGTFVITGNRVTGPGGGTDSPLAGGAGIITGGNAVSVSGNTVTGFSAVMGSVPANTTGWGSGYDWWQGTQSVGIMVGCTQVATLSTCTVENNVVTDNTIGVVGILTNSVFGGSWMAGPLTIEGNYINDSGGYGIYTEMAGQGGGAPATVAIENNWFDNTLSGAPAMDLAGESYEVTGNVMIGTSASGNQGAFQGEGGSGLVIYTASVEASDYWTYSYAPTAVQVSGNLFLDTRAPVRASRAGSSPRSRSRVCSRGRPGRSRWMGRPVPCSRPRQSSATCRTVRTRSAWGRSTATPRRPLRGP
jgi:hypothetical protein